MKKFSLKLIFSVSVAALALASCTYSIIPKHFKKKFNTFSPKDFSVDVNLIYTNKGYYTVKKIFYRSIPTDQVSKANDDNLKDTILKGRTTYSESDFIFFDNGICIRGSRIALKKIDLQTYIQYADAGIYKVCNDTIKIKTLGRNSLLAATVDAYEEWYKVENKNTLRLIYINDIGWRYYNPTLKSTVDSVRSQSSLYSPINEISLNSYSNWLVNKKWFWKNKKEYKQRRRKSPKTK